MYKPLYVDPPAKPMKIREDSLYIAEECDMEELPSFNLPKNLTISGTGKKTRDFWNYETRKKPFEYGGREKLIFTSQSASPARPTKRFINKFSFLKSSTASTTPQKKQTKIKIKPGYRGPSFKKKNPLVVKPVTIKESTSDIWNETETSSEYTSQCCSNRQTPSFEQHGMYNKFI